MVSIALDRRVRTRCFVVVFAMFFGGPGTKRIEAGKVYQRHQAARGGNDSKCSIRAGPLLRLMNKALDGLLRNPYRTRKGASRNRLSPEVISEANLSCLLFLAIEQ